jgi:hypothetical protein
MSTTTDTTRGAIATEAPADGATVTIDGSTWTVLWSDLMRVGGYIVALAPADYSPDAVALDAKMIPASVDDEDSPEPDDNDDTSYEDTRELDREYVRDCMRGL